MRELAIQIQKLREQCRDFYEPLQLAHGYIEADPASSVTKSRMIMEKLLVRIYTAEMGLEPRKPLLGDMLVNNQFTKRLERRILARINSIRDMGNLGPHGEELQPADAVRVLDDLCTVLDWYCNRYTGDDWSLRGGPEEKTAATATAHCEKQTGNAIIPAKTSTDVLILHDDINFAEMIEVIITSHGLNVTMTTDERTALALAQRYRPAAIVLDPRWCSDTLPEQVRELCPGIRVIALVALLEIPENFANRFDRVLNKPIRVSDLMDAIRPPVGGSSQI
jgi:CheY-like chemotaxis protein